MRAAELAIKDFNEAGGFNGRKAELLVRDDKLNPGEAATRTLELIEKDKVDFVVGSLSAATQLSINAVCRDRKILFNSISQSDAINEAKDWSLYTFHEALNLAAVLPQLPAVHEVILVDGGSVDGTVMLPTTPDVVYDRGRNATAFDGLDGLQGPQRPPRRPGAGGGDGQLRAAGRSRRPWSRPRP